MQAKDIMTADVVTVTPATTIRETAQVMVEHRVSALPVLTGDGAIVGIVTESDLLHRSETDTERKRKWWLNIITDTDTRAAEFIKSHAQHVQDVMTRVVVTVSEDTSLADVADILDANQIQRVPVTRNGELIGIISRTDLVRALAQSRPDTEEERLDNGALHDVIKEAIRKQDWINSAFMNYSVNNGIVRLFGFVETESQRRAMKVLVEAVPGVKQVEDDLRLRTWQTAV